MSKTDGNRRKCHAFQQFSSCGCYQSKLIHYFCNRNFGEREPKVYRKTNRQNSWKVFCAARRTELTLTADFCAARKAESTLTAVFCVARKAESTITAVFCVARRTELTLTADFCAARKKKLENHYQLIYKPIKPNVSC